MTNIRRRKAKPRRYADVSVVVPGAREHLIRDEYEYSVDPRYDPPRLDRTLLDPLEAGEPVTLDAWQLPGEPEQSIADYGGLYAVVRVGADDTVTVVAPVDGPLGLPGDRQARRRAHERGLGERGNAGASARDGRRST